jgi:hypothetical protein
LRPCIVLANAMPGRLPATRVLLLAAVLAFLPLETHGSSRTSEKNKDWLRNYLAVAQASSQDLVKLNTYVQLAQIHKIQGRATKSLNDEEMANKVAESANVKMPFPRLLSVWQRESIERIQNGKTEFSSHDLSTLEDRTHLHPFGVVPWAKSLDQRCKAWPHKQLIKCLRSGGCCSRGYCMSDPAICLPQTTGPTVSPTTPPSLSPTLSPTKMHIDYRPSQGAMDARSASANSLAKLQAEIRAWKKPVVPTPGIQKTNNDFAHKGPAHLSAVHPQKNLGNLKTEELTKQMASIQMVSQRSMHNSHIHTTHANCVR